MAEPKKTGANLSSWREQKLTLQPGLNEIVFNDTRPNHIYINNLGAGSVYLGVSVLPSNAVYDKKVDSYGDALYSRQNGVARCEIYSDGANPNDIILVSYDADFTPATMVTQQVTVSGGSGSGGITDVNVTSFGAALPAGSNNIGKVVVTSMPNQTTTFSGALPAGTNNIGKVDVNSAPPLAQGVSHIGSVDIDNAVDINTMPDVRISSMPPVTVSSNPTRTTNQYFEGSIGTAAVDFPFTDGVNATDVLSINFIANDDTTNDLFISFDGVVPVTTGVNGQNGVIKLAPGEVLNNLNRQTSSVHFIRAAGAGNVRFLGV